MNLVIRCLFRWMVGTLLGLAPALAYYLYVQSNHVFRDNEYYSRLTLTIEVGCMVGAILGAIWAARLVIAAYEESGTRRRLGGP